PTAVTAKDSIVLVLPEESDTLDSLGAASGIVSAIHIDNLSDPLTWQSGDDQRIVPTTASTGWEQLAPDKWRFELRQGVKVHNGEDFNAQAAFPSADFLSNADTESNSYGYTGGFTPEVVGDFTMDFNCDAPCPVFPNTTFFLNFTAPEFLATHSESERSRQNMSLGPYKQVEWNSGVSIT
ncbi:MAG: ABC transporter substrate-binding protein, partial [Dehalococcoidia bacterium]|nr:ABC transporter substrate-binding protein [Dehalococcoidia bacterium]